MAPTGALTGMGGCARFTQNPQRHCGCPRPHAGALCIQLRSAPQHPHKTKTEQAECFRFSPNELSLNQTQIRRAPMAAWDDCLSQNQPAGRYSGGIGMQFEYRGHWGPFLGGLRADAETLAEHAQKTGLSCPTVRREENGDYLAPLIPIPKTAQERRSIVRGRSHHIGSACPY
jgi:hypothetical protein